MRWFIWAPPYAGSAGIRVLHRLCHHLRVLGQEAFAATDEIGADPGSLVQSGQWQGDPDDVAVYPDVVCGNPWKAEKVVRYCLNLPGLLGGSASYPPGDLVVFYDTWCQIAASEAAGRALAGDHRIKIWVIEPHLFYNDHACKDLVLGYVGKDSGDRISPPVHVDAWIMHGWPSKREATAALVRQCSDLYTYDTRTALSAEVAVCGGRVWYPQDRTWVRACGGYPADIEKAWHDPAPAADLMALVRKHAWNKKAEIKMCCPVNLPPSANQAPRICLFMNVLNEAPILARCLESVKGLIDYYFIMIDDRTTDDSVEVALKVLDGIPGTVHRLPFVDFGKGRTLAMIGARAAIQATLSTTLDGWWLWRVDADEVIVTEPGFKWPSEMPMDAYHVQMRLGSSEFEHLDLFRASKPWRYEMPTHEVTVCEGGAVWNHVPLQGIANTSPCDSCRRKSGKKIAEDIEWLCKYIVDENHNPQAHLGRACFYLARTLLERGAPGDDDLALEGFRRRTTLPGYSQETYCSFVSIGLLLEKLHAPALEIREAYLSALDVDPERAESLWHLARFERAVGCPARAQMAEAAWATRRPGDGKLFSDRSKYPACPLPPVAQVQQTALTGRVSPKVAIGIITAPRSQDPLPQTLISINTTDPLVWTAPIVVFADEVAEVDSGQDAQWRSYGWRGRTPEEIKKWDVFAYTGVDNMARALEWAAESAGDSGVVVELEDDVNFAAGWLERSILLLEAAEAACPGQAVALSLHHMHTPDKFAEIHQYAGIQTDCDKLYRPIGLYWSNGAQGHVMRGQSAKTLAAALRKIVDGLGTRARFDWPMDRAMWQACKDVGAVLLFVRTCLLQHHGYQGSRWFAKEFSDDARRTKMFHPFIGDTGKAWRQP